MAVGTVLLILLTIGIGVWLIFQLGKMKFKIIAALAILFLAFFFLGFNNFSESNGFELDSLKSVKEAGSMYLSWLGVLFSNAKAITGKATNLSWEPNRTNSSANSTS